MRKPTEKTLLVTHKGCLDGTGSALMFIWAGGKRENIRFRNPNGCALTPEDIGDAEEVWFADLCPPVLDGAGGGLPFHVFDHHLSNQKRYGEDPRCTFSLSHSGTSLMFRELGLRQALDDREREYLPHHVDERDLVEALEAYDLGRFDHFPGQRLADVASTYTQEQMLEILTERDVEEVLFDRDLTQRAEAAAAMRNLYAEAAAKTCRRMSLNFGGEMVYLGVATSPVYWKNEVAERILNSGCAVAVMIDPVTQMVSLRSRPGGPDCSRIAGLFGGGGHARAAGFKGNGARMLDSLTEVVFG